MVVVALGLSGLVSVVIPGCATKHECSDGACSVAPSASRATFLSRFGAQKTVRHPESHRRVVHADATSFDQEVLQADGLVLVDFYADWCRPCQSLAPVLEELAQETPEAKVVKVNIDDSPELARRYGVQSIPTLLLLERGQLADKVTGVRSKSELKGLLASRSVQSSTGLILSTNP
jgi:thioredoxin 1